MKFILSRFVKKIVLFTFLFLLPFLSQAQTLPNPLGEGPQNRDVKIILGKTIAGAMSILGSLALATFVYGGFIWMLSLGNPQKVEKGRNILFWGFLGLIIIFSSYTIVNFLMGDNFLTPFLFF